MAGFGLLQELGIDLFMPFFTEEQESRVYKNKQKRIQTRGFR